MAKRRVGTLSTKLTLNSSEFQRGLRRARISLGKFASAIKNAGLRIAKFGAVIAAGAVAALTLMTRAQLKALDSIAKTSDRLNIQTKALIGLQHAANQLGTDTALLNKGLELMNRRIGEAATGTGEAVEAFELLRVDIVKMQRQDAAKNFGEIFDAINRLPNAFLKASTAADIFGRSGVGLLNLGAVGSVGLKRFREEAERLGIAFSRIDVAKVEAANDAMDRMKKVSSGLAGRFTIEVSPILEAFADFFSETNAERWGQIIRDTVRTVATSIAKMLDALVLAIEPLKVFLETAGQRTVGLAKRVGSPLNTMGGGMRMSLLAGAHALGFRPRTRTEPPERIPTPPVHEPRSIAGSFLRGVEEVLGGADESARWVAWRRRMQHGRGGQPLAGAPAAAAAGAMARAPNIGFRTPGELGLVGGMPNVAAFGRSSPLVQITRTQAQDVNAIRRMAERAFFAGELGGLR